MEEGAGERPAEPPAQPGRTATFADGNVLVALIVASVTLVVITASVLGLLLMWVGSGASPLGSGADQYSAWESGEHIPEFEARMMLETMFPGHRVEQLKQEYWSSNDDYWVAIMRSDREPAFLWTVDATCYLDHAIVGYGESLPDHLHNQREEFAAFMTAFAAAHPRCVVSSVTPREYGGYNEYAVEWSEIEGTTGYRLSPLSLVTNWRLTAVGGWEEYDPDTSEWVPWP